VDHKEIAVSAECRDLAENPDSLDGAVGQDKVVNPVRAVGPAYLDGADGRDRSAPVDHKEIAVSAVGPERAGNRDCQVGRDGAALADGRDFPVQDRAEKADGPVHLDGQDNKENLDGVDFQDGADGRALADGLDNQD
jgi:hypothetical protein